MDDMENTYELLVPIMIDGEKVTEIVLSEPGVDELEAWGKARKKAGANPVAFALRVMADMCEYSAEDLRRLKARDFNALQRKMNELTGNAESSGDEF